MKSSKQKKFLRLVSAWLKGRATAQQVTIVEKYYELFSGSVDLLDNSSPIEEQNIRNRMKAVIDERIQNEKIPVFSLYQKQAFSVAAAILLIVSAGVFFYHREFMLLSNKSSQTAAAILPGSNKAILTLANGSKISLDGTKNGKIAEQFGMSIQKTKNGELIYNNEHQNTEGQLAYNKVEIPKGGQYQLILQDGTKVWLNAASSLRYPLTFALNERKVELTGEAYFEVAKNKAKPFRVFTKRQKVEVLGTHFNVNAYPDERTIKTTLLEGSVSVSSLQSNAKIIIKPGEQSSLEGKGGETTINSSEIDTDEAVAWKNGYFMFENEPLESILRKISRWYDVDIEYQDGDLNNKLFSGTLSKYSDVSKVLKKLELTQSVHFSINGRRIMVMK
ncbi:FecR family protein [Pedobacter sp. L105]|uniref:FecR family protein n=1 Tax=Pedobacter sp. L105 TaxID=1641871 RepID=UPI00131CB082|nr:FecR domain-containing protein [Pedobacter sp. L105]